MLRNNKQRAEEGLEITPREIFLRLFERWSLQLHVIQSMAKNQLCQPPPPTPKIVPSVGVASSGSGREEELLRKLKIPQSWGVGMPHRLHVSHLCGSAPSASHLVRGL